VFFIRSTAVLARKGTAYLLSLSAYYSDIVVCSVRPFAALNADRAASYVGVQTILWRYVMSGKFHAGRSHETISNIPEYPVESHFTD
jgi:hypothetical protein